MDIETAGVANALISSMAIMVEQMDREGAVSKAEMVKSLRLYADAAEDAQPTDFPPGRVDTKIMRMIADTIESGALSHTFRGWSPKVVDGGKASGEAPENSD